MLPWMAPRSSCEIMSTSPHAYGHESTKSRSQIVVFSCFRVFVTRLLQNRSIQVIRTGLPGRTFQVRRLHARDELFERRLKIGGALPLVGRRELCELLLEIKALQLHRQRLVR